MRKTVRRQLGGEKCKYILDLKDLLVSHIKATGLIKGKGNLGLTTLPSNVSTTHCINLEPNNCHWTTNFSLELDSTYFSI